MTAHALSLAAGVSNHSVSQFEAKTRLPRLPTLEHIANVLHMSPGRLAFGVEAPWEPFDGLRCDGLATRLKAARVAQGLTLREVDRRAEIAVGASRTVEAGGMPTLDTIEQLAKALDLSPAWLAFGVGPKKGLTRRRRLSQSAADNSESAP